MRVLLAILLSLKLCATEKVEMLPLDVISYETFIQGDPAMVAQLKKALQEKGIVGIRGVPGYREKVMKFIETAREFSALPEKVKEQYAPSRGFGVLPLGYEKGTEQFKLPNGEWVADDLKATYYALVPDTNQNRWPNEVNLKTPFMELGKLMSEMGTAVMEKIGLLGPQHGISLRGVPRLGRMLYYSKCTESHNDNPYWCGSHFDHGLFTALLPAVYFEEGRQVAEPEEAGLFIKISSDGQFQKIVADDPDLLLFQVGEFAQLVTNDAIRATEHRVHKASGSVERYTMAMFFDPPMDLVVHSNSELAKDVRYGQVAGTACTAQHWYDESYNRYLVK
ncbi:MAG: isopenicillin N synthase family oxygenase [Verrucomicrobia bacterium]|nr:isopenicillin N synthase family oxygenase [Verrucomicrobiota bacterium]